MIFAAAEHGDAKLHGFHRNGCAMTLSDHFVRSGSWLFRWRALPPVLALLLLMLHLENYR